MVKICPKTECITCSKGTLNKAVKGYSYIAYNDSMPVSVYIRKSSQ